MISTALFDERNGEIGDTDGAKPASPRAASSSFPAPLRGPSPSTANGSGTDRHNRVQAFRGWCRTPCGSHPAPNARARPLSSHAGRRVRCPRPQWLRRLPLHCRTSRLCRYGGSPALARFPRRADTPHPSCERCRNPDAAAGFPRVSMLSIPDVLKIWRVSHGVYLIRPPPSGSHERIPRNHISVGAQDTFTNSNKRSRRPSLDADWISSLVTLWLSGTVEELKRVDRG